MTGAELPPEKISLTIDQPDLKISKGKKKRAGSSRGIETLLRSLYRTHLDLTNLADNKANMMITVNGLIVSILLAAGGSVVAVTKDYIYMLPILVLLTSGFVSMFFAVMSARPSTERCCDVKKVPLDFLRGQANVMYFLDNADLTTKEYVGVMKEIVKDRDQVYEEMFVHVHSMGLVLARKFGLLRTAYTVFIYGLGFCVITFIGIVVFSIFNADEMEMPATSAVESAAFNDFPITSGIFEPSGVHQLTDGRVLIVQDELNHPFALLTVRSDGEVASVNSLPSDNFKKKGPYKNFRKLDDLEGIDVANNGYVYAITSHSSADGRYLKNRDKLSRFRVSGGKILEPVVVTGLRERLLTTFPELKQETKGYGFNIEGLTLNAEQDRLFVGFRAPLDKDGKALVAVIDNLDTLFSEDGSFHFVPQLIRLNLDGDAIRGMTYDPRLQGYLIIGGAFGKGRSKESQLWFWDGSTDSLPQLVSIKGLDGIKNAEGVASVQLDGKSRILIVSDDGKKKNGITASFLVVDYEQLQIL